jgi:hypothetical protein
VTSYVKPSNPCHSKTIIQTTYHLSVFGLRGSARSYSILEFNTPYQSWQLPEKKNSGMPIIEATYVQLGKKELVQFNATQ